MDGSDHVSSSRMTNRRHRLHDLKSERPASSHVGETDGVDSHALDGARFPLECLFLIPYLLDKDMCGYSVSFIGTFGFLRQFTSSLMTKLSWV
jgi:hypothetical protein